jgi:ATP-dependent Clp protease protease subunit
MHGKTRRASQPGKPFFKAALQSDGTLELLVYEDIGENWWDSGGITAKTIKQAIDDAGAFDQILVRINSPGGDASEGIAIYNLLRSTHKPVEVCVDGIAASSASIIAMAGDTITMGPNSLMMVHNAWSDGAGYASDHRKLADTLDTVSDAIAQTYIRRTGMAAEDVSAMMDAETWLTAQDCLDQGFANNITEEPGIAETALALARQFKALGRMKHVPKALQNEGGLDGAAKCECDCANCLDGDCDTCTNADCADPNCDGCPMQAEAQASIEDWLDRLGSGPVSIDDARRKLEDIDSHSADAVTIDAARGELDAIEGVLSTPENQLAEPELRRRYASALGRRC